ncbi:ABC transporter ATP-binding protein [Pigmentiphaga sp.]|uniref:ABC transporter ATP-binding protein n=1 Tax=Pigmentiphaga sp. TaxID=1977564 RepID=UPI00128D1998|nr:ABC transporter ATP-binding protein [Pigmentiphaga sp.]MPS25395.1 ABC transporter ATP-binding protein [Alcaligenaceae bacterium SAGV5]MPS54009.1 ABC transporter ATP-binding protein [Alcaligenaceae bacterium SAGV3]MPT58958.1 ABC transporter ATP-binding protein [Alcaligenaceae bacterium]
MNATPVLEARGVARRFPNGVDALSPIDLTVRAGEFVTLLGPSGCGKTTLLRIFAGLDTPTAGSLRRHGAVDELSYVFQDATLMPWASVATNVRLPLDLERGPRRQPMEARRGRVREALERVGLTDFAAARPSELSGGMRMRVSIARALATEPSLLLMDEPFGALDDITRQHLDDELLGLAARQNLTVVFVTHSIFEAVYLSSRVIVLSRRPGRIVADIPIEASARDAAFRVSPAFAMQAARLQAALLEGQQ